MFGHYGKMTEIGPELARKKGQRVLYTASHNLTTQAAAGFSPTRNAHPKNQYKLR